MNTRLIGAAVFAAFVAVGCGKKDASDSIERAGEKPKAAEEVNLANDPNHIEEILALAKKSAKEDNNINFYGFVTGMSRYDAADLATHYKLKEGEYMVNAHPGKAVRRVWFSLQGVRRITGGGNTVDELAQSVANCVGDLSGRNGQWEHRTIDGILVTFSGRHGLSIINKKVATQEPIVTNGNALREANAQKECIQGIIENMVAIPDKSFKMGKYEVTQAQWYVVMGTDPSKFWGDDHPVEQVSWNACKMFVEKLNAMPEVRASGLTFRLPTEAEWEYACRAGGMGDYCRLADGADITGGTLGTVAWFSENSDGKIHPVGKKKPNAFGLYDMLGNVCEWCEDLYDADGPYDSLSRVFRGGDYRNDSGACTAGFQFNRFPDARLEFLGFRLAASQENGQASSKKPEKPNETAVKKETKSLGNLWLEHQSKRRDLINKGMSSSTVGEIGFTAMTYDEFKAQYKGRDVEAEMKKLEARAVAMLEEGRKQEPQKRTAVPKVEKSKPVTPAAVLPVKPAAQRKPVASTAAATKAQAEGAARAKAEAEAKRLAEEKARKNAEAKARAEAEAKAKDKAAAEGAVSGQQNSTARKASKDSKGIRIVVQGKGRTKDAAVRSAIRQAVWRTVGTWVDSKERISANREKVIALVETITEADVRAFEVMDAQEQNGGFVVKVKVSVSKKKIAPKFAAVFPDVFALD